MNAAASEAERDDGRRPGAVPAADGARTLATPRSRPAAEATWHEATSHEATSHEATSHEATWRMADDGDDADGRNGSGNGPGTGLDVITRTKTKPKRPSLYRVLLLNDDFTPMEFVVMVLEKFFQLDTQTATRVMLHVHQHGVGECGVYTYEVAETKVTQVMDYARKNQHPLQRVMEKK